MIVDAPTLWMPPKPAIIRAWKREDLRKPAALGTFPFPFHVPLGPPPTLSYVGRTTLTNDASSYTFTSHALGTAAANRYIVLILGTRTASGVAATITAVTVAGISATIAQQINNGDGTGYTNCTLAVVAVPTGTTGNIDVTFDMSTSRCNVAVWAAYGLASATPVTATATAAGAINVNVLQGGFVVAGAGGYNNAGGFAWTGLSEQYDVTHENLYYGCGASDSNLSAATPRSISFTYGGSTIAAVAGAFR